MAETQSGAASARWAGLAAAVWRGELVEHAIFWLFVAGLAWVPFWYGGNDWLAWGVNAILFPGLAAVYEASLLLRGRRHAVGVRSIALPATLFAAVVLWIAVQTLRGLPASLANPVWGMAADALGRVVHGSISVDRDSTNLALVRLIAAASAFWLALQLCRNGARAALFLASVAAIGGAYAAYGLIAMKTGPLPWLAYLPSRGTNLSSTFINPDCYATYAGLGLMAAAGLILSRYRDAVSGAAGSWRLRVAFCIESTGGRGAALLAGGFTILVALLLSGSRGGVMSAVLGLFVLGLLARRTRSQRRREPFALLLVGFLLVAAILLAFGGVFAGKLDQGGFYDANRIAVYRLTLRSVFDSPVLGWGYGTFRDVFPMYRDRSLPVLGTWAQAHDTYLEVFQGLGVVFGSMLIGCVLILVLRCVKGAVQRHQDVTVPRVAASAAFLVGAHALVDFGLQMQAVALTFIAILGAGVAQSQSSRLALED